MNFSSFLLFIFLFWLGLGQDTTTPSSVVVSTSAPTPIPVELTQVERLQLSVLQADFKRAQAELTAAQRFIENVGLRFSNAVEQFRKKHKVDESFGFDESSMSFVPPPTPSITEPGKTEPKSESKRAESGPTSTPAVKK